MNLQDFFQTQESITRMVIRLDTKFKNVDTDGIESKFQIFIKVSSNWNIIINEIFTLKFPVPFFNCQSLCTYFL